MKLEYLPEGSVDCPLIRLHDFTSAEVKRLREMVIQLAMEKSDRIEVHRLPGVEAINGCQLILCLRSWDLSVVRLSEQLSFECGFTSGTWDSVSELMEPFEQGSSGFQWLAGVPGEAQLLLSPSGRW